MTDERKMKALGAAVTALAEYFDSIQIFVSRYNDVSDQTESYNAGRGNTFSRLGQVDSWVQTQKDIITSSTLDQQEGDDDDEQFA